MTSHTVRNLQFTGVVLLAAGYGWAGGHFYPANIPAWAYLFQFFVLALLLILSLGFFAEQQTQKKKKMYFISLSVVAALTLAINVVNVLRGFQNTTAFGSHNTLADLLPISFLLLGSFLWLITIPSQKK